MGNNSETVIHVNNLSKRFDGFTAVNAISFNVRQGEIFGFLGPNGSGKTTTIRMMLGLLQPTQGEIEVLGIPISQGTREIQPRVGYMSQHFSLYNDLSVQQNLQFYGQAYGLDKDLLKTRMQEAIAMADLEGHQHTPTKNLSGGWRQRLALSAAILHRPNILFLDEPTAGVDPLSRREFWDLLYQFVEEGVTVFITTHYMDEAEHCHRLAFLQRGQIIAYGSPEIIKADQMEGEVMEIEPSNAAQAVQALNTALENGEVEAIDIQLYGSLVHVIGPNVKKQKRKLRRILSSAQIDIHSMTINEPSLEDVFIACMREGATEVLHEE
jgi:ABC-2 type transport system ATP-binding protein